MTGDFSVSAVSVSTGRLLVRVESKIYLDVVLTIRTEIIETVISLIYSPFDKFDIRRYLN